MWKYLMAIIRYSIIGGDKPVTDDNIDWGKIYSICQFHKIEAIVCNALNKLADDIKIPHEIYQKFQMDFKISVTRDCVQEYSKEELFLEFEREQIDYLPLKGIIMKQFYPKPELRMMADLDILFRKEQEKKVDRILKKLGYHLVQTTTKDKEYLRKPFMNIEMHYEFVDEGIQFTKYYENPWKRAIKLNNGSCQYSVNWDDFYIYMMVHLAKHFQYGGSGIRSIIDIWLFERKIVKLDWEYINIELESLQLQEFTKHIRHLSKIWFDGEQSSKVYDDLTTFIIESGVFGTEKNLRKINVAKADQNITKGKIKTWVSKLLPPISLLKDKYTYLKKHPYLIGVAWIHRLISSVVFKRKRIKTLVSIMNAKSSEVRRIQELFDKIGLNH